MFYIEWDGHWPQNLEVSWLTPIAFIIFTLLYGIVGTLIGIVFLGIPAAVSGLLRLLPMRGLFRLSMGRPAILAYTPMLVGTFILFETCVLPIATLWLTLSPTSTYQGSPTITLYDTWLKVSLLSLPWLLSSLYTSWQLIRPTVMGSKQQL